LHRSVYHAIDDLKSKGQEIDILTISRLIKGGKGVNVAFELSLIIDQSFEYTEAITCIGILTEEFQKR